MAERHQPTFSVFRRGMDLSSDRNAQSPPDAPDDDDFMEPAALDAQTQDRLGEIFQSYCQEMINQPIPEKFLVLLAKLEAKERGKK